MTQLQVHGIGKRYHRTWIFRDISFSLSQGEGMALTGPNGSGKSTLLRILSGRDSATEGKAILTHAGKEVPREQWYRHISWAGPWMDLYPDLTLAEMARLHFSLRTCLLPQGAPAVIDALALGPHRDKTLRVFSSGMLHRVKMGLALFSDCRLLLLDEATANLDPENSAFIFRLLEQHRGDRMIIFATNAAEEFGRFGRRLHLG